MSKQIMNNQCNYMSFKDRLRHEFKTFEMQKKEEVVEGDYPELEDFLKKKFDELFGPSDI